MTSKMKVLKKLFKYVKKENGNVKAKCSKNGRDKDRMWCTWLGSQIIVHAHLAMQKTIFSVTSSPFSNHHVVSNTLSL